MNVHLQEEVGGLRIPQKLSGYRGHYIHVGAVTGLQLLVGTPKSGATHWASNVVQSWAGAGKGGLAREKPRSAGTQPGFLLREMPQPLWYELGSRGGKSRP